MGQRNDDMERIDGVEQDVEVSAGPPRAPATGRFADIVPIGVPSLLGDQGMGSRGRPRRYSSAGATATEPASIPDKASAPDRAFRTPIITR